MYKSDRKKVKAIIAYIIHYVPTYLLCIIIIIVIVTIIITMIKEALETLPHYRTEFKTFNLIKFTHY